MKNIQNNYIDCIITSPPYNLGGDFHTFVNGKRVTYGDYKGFKDKLSEKEYTQSQLDLLNECYRIVKNDGWMFYNHKNRIINGTTSSPLEWILQSKWNLSQIVVLDFGATANVDKRRFFPVHELLFVLNKDIKQKLHNDDCLTDVWKMKKVPRKISGHPATFDIELPLRCIKASTKEGDIVFDPYAGTGTTLLAAKLLNRQYIGSEISEEYYQLSLKKLKINDKIRFLS
jgi:site-specific DNA-methyltransferase (adenine-specific)